jgi:hypothetical protein
MLLPNKNIKIFKIFKANTIFFVLAFFLFYKNSYSQCTPNEIPFKSGEQLNYDAYYNLKNIWVPAGKVRFEVSDSVYNNKPCFYLQGRAKSLKNYDSFFKVRDKYASVVDKKTLEPQRFERDIIEGGFSLYYNYFFDNIKHIAKVFESKTDTTKQKSFEFPPCTFDVISAVYYARTLNFDRLKIGDTIVIPLMLDKQIYNNVYVRYTGKDRVKDKNDVYYNCIKFRPTLIEGTIFQEGEFMEVYVTDDRNHIPIYIEAEILVGSVKAYLTSYKNVKYPVTSRIN